LEQEDLRWKQRAKVNWLKSGDRNIKFYHACANQQQRSNQILKIADAAGITLESPEDIKVDFVNYFTNLFIAGTIGNMEECLQPIIPKVTETMNKELLKIFTNEEVSLALKQMAPLKAPGPDGLLAGFF
jgi:hypothetical protein